MRGIPVEQFLISLGTAIAFNLPIYFIAKKKKLLTPDGIITAAILGVFLFIVTPLAWMLLIAFFLSSSLLSKVKGDSKKHLHEKFSKGSQRDAGQVLANGGLPALLLLGYVLTNVQKMTIFLQLSQLNPLSSWLLGYAAAVATVNSDTFATEIGTISKRPPRNILRPWERVPPGTSGGITLLGTGASFVGALEIAILYVSFLSFFSNYQPLPTLTRWSLIILLITTAGLTGSLIDSVLGATIQEMFWCIHCKKETEQSLHVTCHSPTKKIRGIIGFNNDLVNFVSALITSVMIMIISTMLFS